MVIRFSTKSCCLELLGKLRKMKPIKQNMHKYCILYIYDLLTFLLETILVKRTIVLHKTKGHLPEA